MATLVVGAYSFTGDAAACGTEIAALATALAAVSTDCAAVQADFAHPRIARNYRLNATKKLADDAATALAAFLT